MNKNIFIIGVMLITALILAGCSGDLANNQVIEITPTPISQATPNPNTVIDQTATPAATKPPGNGRRMEANLAPVDTVDIRILESFPVQVTVAVKGNLPTPCKMLGDTTVKRTDTVFEITIPMSQPEDALCAQVLKPFEKNIPLDVAGLKKGTYTVGVNGVIKTFTLQADN